MQLQRLLRTRRADLLLATGNFGLRRPPVPQVLWNRNALYFSPVHLRRLLANGQAGEIARTLLGRRWAVASIRASEANLTPTAAFRDQIVRSVPSLAAKRFHVLPFGVDVKEFDAPTRILRESASATNDVFRVLLVSHYNLFRNFETLIRAAAVMLSRRCRPFQIVLTTRLGAGVKDHRYDTSRAHRLVERLGVAHLLAMGGPTPRDRLASLYGSADVVVCPSYAESFGHPLVEAMAAGRPIVASDQPTHRELCGDAASFFSTFDPHALADCIVELMEDPLLRGSRAESGRRRASRFCWNNHFESLTSIVEAALRGATKEKDPCELDEAFAAYSR
jgi:glycosyltransferase involved in cell wall biosynthesis